MSDFGGGSNGSTVYVSGEDKTGLHILTLESREHIKEIIPGLGGIFDAKLGKGVLSVEHHRECTLNGNTVCLAVILIMNKSGILETGSYIVEALHIIEGNKEVSDSKVYGKFSADKHCNVRALACENRFHNSTLYKVDRNINACFGSKFGLSELLYNSSLVTAEAAPYNDGISS